MSDLPTYVMYRGDTRTFTLRVLASGLSATGINGMLFTFTAKRKVSDPDSAAVLIKHNASFTVVTVGNSTTDAVLTYTITPTDTASFPVYTVLQMDVRVQDSGGNVQTLARGVLIVDDIVTGVIS